MIITTMAALLYGFRHSPAHRKRSSKAGRGLFYRSPYMRVKGWVGIKLDQISENDLAQHVREAYRLIAQKSKVR